MDVKNSAKTELLNFLRSHRLMSLATAGKDGPWISTVYYAVAENLDIYFLSHPKSRHAVEATDSSKAAVAVADTNQEILDSKVGVQMTGTVEIIGQSEEHELAMELWLDAMQAHNDKQILEQASVRFMVGTVFRFRPQKIRFLNEKLFGPNGIKDVDNLA